MTDMKVGIKITADGKQTIGEVGRVVESVENIGTATYRAGRKASDGIISISTQLMRLQGLAAAGMGVSGLGDLVKLTDEYGQMASRIKMATDSVEEYEAVQARLLETASNTYRPLSEAQEMYLRTSDALKSLGYSTREALDVADSFSYLMVTNAASGERAAGAISAYSKALQKGRVDADAWQSILAATPTIVEKISSATGRTAEEIRKMGAEGKLALADLNEGLRQSLQQNMADAAKMPATVADAFTALRNSLQAYLGEANEATGLTQLFVGALESLAKNVDRLAKTGVAAAASAIAYLGIAAASATVKFGQMTAASMAAAGVQRAQAAAAVDVARAELAATEATIAHYSAIRVLAVSSSRMLPLYAARARAAAALAAAERNAQAAAAETSVLTQRMTLASVAANRLSVALGAVGAGFVGWEVGSWLRQFDLVKKIGNEVVEVLLDLWATQVFVAKALTMPWKISASWDEYIAKLKETRASMKAANEAIDAGLYDAGVGDDAAESLEQPSAAAEKLKEQMDAASEAARGLGISLAEFGPVVTPEFEKVTGQVDTLIGSIDHLKQSGVDVQSVLSAAFSKAIVSARGTAELEELQKRIQALAAAGDLFPSRVRELTGQIAGRMADIAGGAIKAREAAKALGLELSQFSSAVSPEFEEVETHLDSLVAAFDQLKASGVDTGAALRDALEKALSKTKNPADLLALTERVKALGEEGKLARPKMLDLFNAIKDKARDAGGEAKTLRDEINRLKDEAESIRSGASPFDVKDSGKSPEQLENEAVRKAKSAVDDASFYAQAARAATLDGRAEKAAEYAEKARAALAEADKAAENLSDDAKRAVDGDKYKDAKATLKDTEAAAKQRKQDEMRAATEAQEAQLAALETRLDELIARANAGATLQIDTGNATPAVDALKASIDALPTEKTVTINVVENRSGAAAGDAALPAFATGGLLPGHSPNDRADNILYRGTAGEYLLPRNIVRQPGMYAFLERLRRQGMAAIKGYADGGLLARAATAQPLSRAGPSGGGNMVPAVFNIPSVGRVPVNMGADVAAELSRALSRENLMRGKR